MVITCKECARTRGLQYRHPDREGFKFCWYCSQKLPIAWYGVPLWPMGDWVAHIGLGVLGAFTVSGIILFIGAVVALIDDLMNHAG